MNTLKFGNGEWYGKEDTILAYNDENSNYKPLPFDFSRASSATVINKDGLIETVGSGEPRIDYKDDTKGALLLEPTRTNLITYSEDFSNSYWGKSRVSVSTNQSISPNGTLNADELSDDANNQTHFIQSVIVTNNSTFSVFAKQNTLRYFNIGATSNLQKRVVFDLQEGVSSRVGTSVSNYGIEDYGNGWHRCWVELLASERAGVFTSNSSTSLGAYVGDGSSIYIWGAQVEEGSYATSYIPTNGSAVTRLAESCSQTAPDAVIGQTEGTMFFEAKINTQGTYTGLSLSDNTTNNEVIIRFTTQDRIEYYLRSGGTQPIGGGTTAFDTDDYVKVAFAYKSGDSAFYVNGTQVITSTTTTMPVSLSSLKFSRGNNTGVFEGRTKDLRVYNTRLTDQELIALTQV
jgi:hypothetical protein